MAERLSFSDETLLSCYSEHVQRYEFALPFCEGKRVLDAGCGVGYGSHLLASRAESVLAIDISDHALSEAAETFKRKNLRFQKADAETISALGKFDAIVNFENLEHLSHPREFIREAAASLNDGGVLITSTPNGNVAIRNTDGTPANPFHVQEYTESELRELLSEQFRSITLHGQWITFPGLLNRMRNRQLFEALTEIHYGPLARVVRFCKAALGKKVASAPTPTILMDTRAGDFHIAPISDDRYPWEPAVLIAVVNN